VLSCELVQQWLQCLVLCRGALKWSAVLGYSLDSVADRRRLLMLQVRGCASWGLITTP
jgi:hypothetical protein